MPNVAEPITEHVALTVDCVDRLYLNACVPLLLREGGVVAFLRPRGQPIPSLALFGHITEGFKAKLQAWAARQGIPWIEFQKGERKDEVVQKYRDRFPGRSGVVWVGVAKERAKAWTATKGFRGRHVHFAYRWKTVCVNHYYLYVLDPEWGPALLKVCGYAPYAMSRPSDNAPGGNSRTPPWTTASGPAPPRPQGADSPGGRQALLDHDAPRAARGPVPDQTLRPGHPAGLPGARPSHHVAGPTSPAAGLRGPGCDHRDAAPGGATCGVGA
jgi:hypothetical protein